MEQEIENIALLDMDGTLVDYEAAMAEGLKSLSGPNEPAHSVHEDGPPYIKERKRLIKDQPDWWYNLKRIKLGFDLYEEVKRLDFKIHILTKGPWEAHSAWSEKVRWCRDNLDSDVGVTITEDKGLVYGRVLIDDWPPYMERWLQWRPRGLGIMPARLYNEGFEHPNVIRYDGTNMEQITQALIKIKKRNLG